MSLSREVFDPDGDIFLLLERTDEAPDNVPTDEAPTVNPVNPPAVDPNSDAPDDDAPNDDIPTADALADDAPAEDAPAGEAVNSITTNTTLTDNIHADRDIAVEASEHAHNTSLNSRTRTTTRQVEIQVSSKHLSLASKVFRDMLQGKSLKDLSSCDKDMVTIPLREDDYSAWQILLNVIHGLTRRVPRQVDVLVFSQVIVLIDKYELQQVVEVFTDMWFDYLRPTMPRRLDENLASWIYICWWLNKADEYQTLTKTAIWETSYGLEDHTGRVPFWIVGEIHSRRQDILTNVLRTLSRLLDCYIGSRHMCHQNTDCDALALGKFIRGLKNNGLYPIPNPPSLKRSIEDVFSAIRSIELSPVCGGAYRGRHRRGFYDPDEVYKHLGEEVQDSLSIIEANLRGLTLHNASHEGQVQT